jgi:hypothetical protein
MIISCPYVVNLTDTGPVCSCPTGYKPFQPSKYKKHPNYILNQNLESNWRCYSDKDKDKDKDKDEIFNLLFLISTLVIIIINI